ncbi:hypothetical protein FZC66_07385 [Priestia megaterium]|nr:hypothetical protein FZC66_07385 [Priestia megaterium]
MKIGDVKGSLVDNQTRCTHYHSKKDIIAIKFYCCKTYYPCYKCHEEHANHSIRRWPKSLFNQQAILCGACKTELTIEQYLSCHSSCPVCHSSFNPGCSSHTHIYFEG